MVADHSSHSARQAASPAARDCAAATLPVCPLHLPLDRLLLQFERRPFVQIESLVWLVSPGPPGLDRWPGSRLYISPARVTLLPKDKKNSVRTETRHALKKDKFAIAAASSASWVNVHRSSVVRWAIAGGVALAIIIAVLVTWSVRSSGANAALGAAMDIYNAPLTEPGEPPQAGQYATAEERAAEANREFAAVAQKYGWMKQGKMARYFVGVTDQELGETAQAESELKPIAGSWNRNLGNLAKVAMAGVYHQTGKDSQAIDLYNQVIARPSVTVSANAARLDLASLYSDEGKTGQARALWAKVQDSDKQGAAGEIAAQKLAGPQE